MREEALKQGCSSGWVRLDVVKPLPINLAKVRPPVAEAVVFVLFKDAFGGWKWGSMLY